MKRNIKLLASLVILLTLIFGHLANYPAQASSQTFKHLTLTWVDDPHTTQVITWQTDSSIISCFLRYVEARNKAAFLQKAITIKATSEEFDTDLGPVNLHTAMLTHLKPSTTYLYQVGTVKEWGELHTFTTEADKTNSFKFLVFGDSQSGDAKNPEYKTWMITCQKAFQANPQAKFFINLGDLVEEGQSYLHWNKWFDASKGIIDTISFVPVVGNHETYNPNTYIDGPPIFWVKQFKVSQNGPKGLKSQAYSFDYGNVHFVILDSQGKEEKCLGDILQLQKDWLENDLKATKQQWKIVLFHKPIYSTSPRGNEDVTKAFQSVLDKYNVKLVLNGHEHVIARTYPIFNNQVINDTNRGTIYYTVGRSGNKFYKNLSSIAYDAFFYNPEDQPNYLVVSVETNYLLLNTFKQDGTLLDSYVIKNFSAKNN